MVNVLIFQSITLNLYHSHREEIAKVGKGDQGKSLIERKIWLSYLKYLNPFPSIYSPLISSSLLFLFICFISFIAICCLSVCCLLSVYLFACLSVYFLYFPSGSFNTKDNLSQLYLIPLDYLWPNPFLVRQEKHCISFFKYFEDLIFRLFFRTHTKKPSKVLSII